MNEQMEKLVEKIITIAAECVSIEEHPLCCWCAEKIAILILSAVRDGLEIPGEEARIKDCYISELGGYRNIIALAGTGKEEARNADGAGQRD